MSSRLPETELANWAFLSPSQKWDAIERHLRPKKIVGTYEPFRKVFGDTVNKQLPLFSEEEQPSTPWDAIEHRLRIHCGSNVDVFQMNLAIARSTHEYAAQSKLIALPIDVTSIAFGVGHLYQFGLTVLMRYPDRVAAVFVDLRRTNGLSILGREWVFSAMHERFRVAYPDLASVDLEAWRYRNNDTRSIAVTRLDGEPRYSFDEIAADARETYRIYASVEAGETERKRRGSGGFGPLFD